MNLLVDLGNSRLKWALQRPGRLAMQAAVARDMDPRQVLDAAWADVAPPARVLAACVAGSAWCEALDQWAQARWGVRVEFAQAREAQCGVRAAYREPHTLGVDRWAALIAARALAPRGACIVDCGTAVTVDALDADGLHRGGVIFPGLALLRAALARGTEAIGSALGNEESVLARATPDAVAAGTLHGLAGAIARMVDEQSALAGPLAVLFTGGDAPKLQVLLRREVQLVPDLVLQGLARIADEAAT